MPWSPLLTGLLHRKLWKAVEVAFVAGLRQWSAWRGREYVRDTKDRRALDRDILPRLAAHAACRRVLFVGCDWYTRHYESIFAGKDYWTLEVDPDRARHGAPQHIVGDLASLGTHFADGWFDLIVCNGVLGWGLNEASEIERSFDACARALRSGGVLVLGYNDVPEKLPMPIGTIRALEAFSPAPGFPQPVVTDTYNRHTYLVLARHPREAGSSAG